MTIELTPEQRKFIAICEQSRRLRDLFANPDAALADAEARGYRAGVEAAAGWHDAEAEACDETAARDVDGGFQRFWQNEAEDHRQVAAALRALADKPRKPL